MDDYSNADPELQKTIIDILSTTESVYSERYEFEGSDQVLPILPEPLCSLVMRRPQDFDRINDIILDHGVSDAEQIEMMFDSDAPSLKVGIL